MAGDGRSFCFWIFKRDVKMRRKNLSLEQVLSSQTSNQFTLLNCHPDLLPQKDPLYLQSQQWYINYKELLDLFPEYPIESFMDDIKAEYIIEYPLQQSSKDERTNTFTWVYFYAIENRRIKDLTKKHHRSKYVYILGRESTPNLLKIGKALDPVSRLKSINSAGILDEWRILYVLPVTDDYKVESLVHKRLSHLRKSSYQGSSREFFEVDLDLAIKTLNEAGSKYYAGEGVRYE